MDRQQDRRAPAGGGMNIKTREDAGIDQVTFNRIAPIARLAIEGGKILSIADVEEFYQKMHREGVADHAIVVASEIAKDPNTKGGMKAIRPLREWADQYRPQLLSPPQRS
jgi:hypothetical protein